MSFEFIMQEHEERRTGDGSDGDRGGEDRGGNSDGDRGNSDGTVRRERTREELAQAAAIRRQVSEEHRAHHINTELRDALIQALESDSSFMEQIDWVRQSLLDATQALQGQLTAFGVGTQPEIPMVVRSLCGRQARTVVISSSLPNLSGGFFANLLAERFRKEWEISLHHRWVPYVENILKFEQSRLPHFVDNLLRTARSVHEAVVVYHAASYFQLDVSFFVCFFQKLRSVRSRLTRGRAFCACRRLLFPFDPDCFDLFHLAYRDQFLWLLALELDVDETAAIIAMCAYPSTAATVGDASGGSSSAADEASGAAQTAAIDSVFSLLSAIVEPGDDQWSIYLKRGSVSPTERSQFVAFLDALRFHYAALQRDGLRNAIIETWQQHDAATASGAELIAQPDGSAIAIADAWLVALGGYLVEDAGSQALSREGFTALCNSLTIDERSLEALALTFYCGGLHRHCIPWASFVMTCEQLGCTDAVQLRPQLESLRDACRGADRQPFFDWCFEAAMPRDSPAVPRAAARLPGPMAAELLETICAGSDALGATYAALARFLRDNAEARHVSRDDWAVMQHFLASFPEVSQLAQLNWMEESYLPSLLDDFVEHVRWEIPAETRECLHRGAEMVWGSVEEGESKALRPAACGNLRDYTRTTVAPVAPSGVAALCGAQGHDASCTDAPSSSRTPTCSGAPPKVFKLVGMSAEEVRGLASQVSHEGDRLKELAQPTADCFGDGAVTITRRCAGDVPAAPAPPAPVEQQRFSPSRLLEAMGFPREMAVAALRAAFGDADRAVQYLMDGIPDDLMTDRDPPAPAAPAAQPAAARAPPAAAQPAGGAAPVSADSVAMALGNGRR